MRIAWLAIGLICTASAGAEALYRVPWPVGLSFMFIQAADGRTTSHFTKATRHAVDIGMPEGIAILAARAGVVEAVESGHGVRPLDEPLTYEGNFVRVRHADDTAAIYAHLRHAGVAVVPGQTVAAGQLLGYSGSTGDVIAPHLHFVVVRVEKNSAGWPEEVSVPVRFYVGLPPVTFAARVAVRVTANYASPVPPPRAPSEGAPLFPWKPRELDPAGEVAAWGEFALLLACGGAGLAWLWRFSRR